jgi:hypothetical protein
MAALNPDQQYLCTGETHETVHQEYGLQPLQGGCKQ